MKKQVTIREIAKEAGVSIATVSMILNNKDKKISEETRGRVLEVADRLHYIPNTMARSLVTRRTKTIGLIMPDITNPFFTGIARGAEDKANESRYSIIYCNSDDDLDREDQYIETLTEKMVDGVILAHSVDRDIDFSSLKNGRIPIVLIDRDYALPGVVGKVMVDNEEASYKGVRHLLDRGYRRIAYIAGPMKTQTAKDRLEGYKKAIQGYGFHFDEALVKSGIYKSNWGENGVKEFLEEGIAFDAIFCGNDMIAVGAMKALKKEGLNVPEEVGVMGFDDIYPAALVEPELTTVRQPNYEMGYKAAGLLIETIEGNGSNRSKNGKEIVKIMLETKLIVRKST